MPSGAFVHLHLHLHYSLLDGATRIKPLIEKAKSMNMPAVAITDHGNMFGAIEFYNAAKSAGVKPIISCQTHIAPGDRRVKHPLRPKRPTLQPMSKRGRKATNNQVWCPPNSLDAYVDKGYRGHGYTGSTCVHIAGSKLKNGSRSERRRRLRRSVIEPNIGHLKSDHRMNRCFLAGLPGDATNAVLAAAGSNMLKLLRRFVFAMTRWLERAFVLPNAHRIHCSALLDHPSLGHS